MFEIVHQLDLLRENEKYTFVRFITISLYQLM